MGSRRHGLAAICFAALALAVSRTSYAAPEQEQRAFPTTICLTAHDPFTKAPDTGGKLLVRELLRQAVLIAARDELGLATRDMTLRETMVSEGPAYQLDAVTTERLTASPSLRLAPMGKDEAEPIFDKQLSLLSTSREPLYYRELAAAAEELSRTELVTALTKAGFAGQANKWNRNVRASEKTLQRLGELNFFSQFAALRELHALQRQEGESPHTLGAIVRAYANLGQLTNFHWNAAHKAFKARALLYAQRLVNRDKESPWALRHRAYAEAMIGLHALALEDLKTARSKDGGAEDALAETPWEPYIDALCRYDGQAITAPANEDLAQLVAFLAYLVVEDSNCESQTLTIGRATLETVPECYAVCDSMGRYSGVINRHMTTVQGPTTLAESLARRLREMPDLPSSIDDALADDPTPDFQSASDPAWQAGPHRVQLVRSLVHAGDPTKDSQEPSWELLGRMLEDVTFVHVYRRLQFFQDGLGLPSQALAPQVKEALPTIDGHPYLPLVKCITFDPQRDAKSILTNCQDIDFRDAEMNMYPAVLFTWYAYKTDHYIGATMWDGVQSHADCVAQDLEQLSYYARKADLAQQLRRVSPHSPQAIALLLTYDASNSQPHLNEWKEEFGQHAVALKALAIRYQQLGQLADAEDCLKRYIAQSPDQWGFESLASIYWTQKQEDKWKETLDESLQHEDFALSHARTRTTIANYYMEKKEWDKAMPYARAAAATGAAWAMLCAAQCHEGLEEWDQAEQLVRMTSERYSTSQMDWFMWCCRTGHGDRDAALTLAKRYAPFLSINGSPYDLTRLGIYHLLSDRKDLAQAAFQKAFNEAGQAFVGLHLAMLAEEAGDTAQRDKLLVEAVDRGPSYKGESGVSQAHIEMAKWLNNAYREPVDSQPVLDSLEDVAKMGVDAEKASTQYFAGRYFQQRGNLDLARKHYERCLDLDQRSAMSHILASVALRALPADDAKPEEDKEKPR